MGREVSIFGTVKFDNGAYSRASGSTNWKVEPIPGFGLPVGPPLGQVKVEFAAPLKSDYTVLVTAQRIVTTPMLCVNCEQTDRTGFVVNIFEPVSTRTLQNGGFSFLVIAD